MSKATEKLKPIPPDRTVTFYSPVEGEEVMVRTGVVESPQSYIHALLYSGMSRYSVCSRKEREEMVAKIAKKLFSIPDEKTWFRTVDRAEKAIVTNFMYHITYFYETVGTEKNKNKSPEMKEFFRSVVKDSTMLDFYKVICELIPVESLDLIYKSFGKKVVGREFSDWKEVAYKLFVSVLDEDEEFNQVSEDRRRYVKKLIKHLVAKAINNSKTIAYSLYVENMKKEMLPSTKNFSKIAEILDRDIYVLDHSSRMLSDLSPEDPKRRSSIIVLSFDGGKHFEPAGILLPGNRIQRDIKENEELVDKLYLLTTNPGEARENYPELRLDSMGRSPVKRSPAKSVEGSVISSIEDGSSASWSDEEDSDSD